MAEQGISKRKIDVDLTKLLGRRGVDAKVGSKVGGKPKPPPSGSRAASR